MKKIPLTKGKFALVDDEDFPYISRFHWKCTQRDGYSSATRTFYSREKKGSGMSLFMEFLLIEGKKGFGIQHINKNTLDNRKKNLRLATYSESTTYARKRNNATSKYKGVYWHPKNKKWCASIRKEGKSYYLGGYSTENKAAYVYNKKARELYGEYAYQNIIE